MNTISDPNNPGWREGSSIGGYVVERVVLLEEIKAVFYSLRHGATGARHIHISNEDAENTFSVGFKTIPEDSTGVAHILEHTVLCGSKKFPVRDPFFSMIKRSLNTFMNAFTASDWTMYPFSSQNKKDFNNLLDVYLDAAFFPLIEELSFKQEGHRLEIENDAAGEARLAYKGVVYNEMKGAMSSPGQVMVRSLMNALYPDTTYRNNSGGDPAEIPKLTHQQLTSFHGKFYHPVNSFFYTYGNMPLADHLRIIEEKVLNRFSPLDLNTDVPPQKRWAAPREAVYTYPLSENEDPSKKCQACLAWLTADINDAVHVLSLMLLEDILLGNAASPLRKALIDSGLGSALSDGSGYDRDNRDTLFSCGLKDVAESSADKIRDLILQVLADLSQNGIEKGLIESAIHQMELHRKEVTNTPYPYGLQLLLTITGSWYHGGDPVGVIQFDENLRVIREALSREAYFEGLIKRFFLDNPHRVLLKLVPDTAKAKAETERVSSELRALQEKLKPEDLEKIRQDQEALVRLQDAKEDIACLPTLELDDIPPDVKRVAAADMAHPAFLYPYSLPTSGILYYTSVIGIDGVDPAHLNLVPFFAYVFSKMGSSTRNYVELARAISAYTGGIQMSAHARSGYLQTGGCLPLLSLSGKCLDRNSEKMFEIIKELVHQCRLTDLDRLKSLLLQYRSGMEAAVVQSGHQFAMALASRSFSRSVFLSEMWNGIHQLLFIKKLTGDIGTESLERISADLMAIARGLLAEDNVKIALVGDAEAIGRAMPMAQSLFSGLKPVAVVDPISRLPVESVIPAEGWSTSSAVSFVAHSFKTARMDHEDGPALFVISKLLRSMYLHREIREKGGAYGGMAVYNMEEGIFSLGSYRDPHIVPTLQVFEGVLQFMRSGEYDQVNVKEAILQACSEIDRPDAPGAAGQKAFFRQIVGLSDEQRQKFKEGLLSVTPGKVLQTAEKYFNSASNRRGTAVISGDAQLQEANAKLEVPLELHPI